MIAETPKQRPEVRTPPLIPVAIAVGAGIVADRYGEGWDTATWGVIALTGTAVAVLGWRRSWVGIAGLLLGFVALGGGWHHHHWSDLAADDLAWCVFETPRPAWVRGVLREVPGTRPGETATTRAVLDVSGIRDGERWRAASGRVQVVILGGRPDLQAGQAVEAAGSLAPIAGPLNPGEFDYRGYQRAQGIRLRLTVDSPEGVWDDPSGPLPLPSRWIGAARAWSHARLVEGLDPSVAPLAAALLLGRREEVDVEVNDAFARTGTTHLLAISGLHLQVLAGVFWFAFRLAGLGRRGAFAAVAVSTVLYALLVGLMPSVVRSTAMTVTACVAGLRDRRTRPANILALAALVTLLLNPAHLFDVGCQLSFLAIGAIVWGVKPASNLFHFAYLILAFRYNAPGSALDQLERRLEPWWLSRMRRWPLLVTSGLVTSLVVWVVALPLVALRFHIVSPIGILLNLPLIPLTSLALMAAGLALGLSAIWPPLGMPAAWVGATCLSWTETIVRWGASQSWGYAFVPGPPWSWTLVAYLLLALAATAGVRRHPSRRWAWGLLLSWLALGPIVDRLGRRPERLEADVLAVGHGLAVIIQDSEGHAWLYDCGRMRDPSVGRRIVAPALWARGVRHLEAVILSHADSDHYDGLPELLDRFSIAAVRVAPGFGGPTNPGAVRLLEDVRARGIPIRPIAEGDHWEPAGATVSVWHPPSQLDPSASDNARSVVLDVESGGRHTLLTGDLEQEGLDALVRRPSRPIDVFLAPHHGGRTANPEWLYDWAKPSTVVVSQRPPSQGTRDVLTSLETRGIPLLRTWQRGAVRLHWEPGQIDAIGFLDRELGLAPRPSESPASRPVFASIGPSWSRGFAAVLGFAVGLAACLVLAVSEWGAWALVLPGRRLASPETDAEPTPELGTPIEATAPDGTRLAGVWIPAEAPSGRTVLLVHGFAEGRNDFRERVEFLARSGWNVSRLDMRGYGRSGGTRASFGGREAGDLRAWIDALAGRTGPAPTFAVWGRSMGAAIAARTAAEDPRVAALVLESPFTDLEIVVAGWLAKLRLPLPHLLARLIALRARSLAGVSLTRPRPIDLATRIGAPALILHGSNDRLVPTDDARRLADAFPAPPSRIEVAGAGHGDVIEVGGPELLGRIASFLDEVTPRRNS